jgi:hypothetical protein
MLLFGFLIGYCYGYTRKLEKFDYMKILLWFFFDANFYLFIF